jgi:hypothetical protein
LPPWKSNKIPIGFHLSPVSRLLIPDAPAEALGFATLTANLYRLNLYRRLGTARRALQESEDKNSKIRTRAKKKIQTFRVFRG